VSPVNVIEGAAAEPKAKGTVEPPAVVNIVPEVVGKVRTVVPDTAGAERVTEPDESPEITIFAMFLP
jgi:hypothetical protein